MAFCVRKLTSFMPFSPMKPINSSFRGFSLNPEETLNPTRFRTLPPTSRWLTKRNKSPILKWRQMRLCECSTILCFRARTESSNFKKLTFEGLRSEQRVIFINFTSKFVLSSLDSSNDKTTFQ